MLPDRILCLVRTNLDETTLERGRRVATASHAELVLATFAVRAPLEIGLDVIPFDPPVLANRASPPTMSPEVIADTGRIVVELGVTLIVVPGELAAIAVSLAESLRRPVMVARPTCGERVVIATDLDAPGHPVLHGGVRFATQLAAPTVAVHNIPEPASDQSPSERAQVRRSVERLGVLKTVIAHEPSTPHAIFDVAGAVDADVIVVGVRPRSWLRRQLGTGVPERIAREAGCSVLVIPICHAMA